MGARAPPHKQASVLRPTPAIVRGAWVTANNTRIESLPTFFIYSPMAVSTMLHG